MVLRKGDFFTGVREACKLLQGAFSLVVLSGDGRLAAVRDPNGYRPLCLGESREGLAVASESCALDSCGFTFLRDVAPGEIVLLERGKLTHSERCLTAPRQSLCVFEYVYFARPDSVIDGLGVYEARLNMGRALAREHPVEADLVCGVPDSGLEAAMGYALESGIPYASGLCEEPLHRPQLYLPHPGPAGARRGPEAQPPAVGGGGQAGGAGGRLHRPGDHLRQDRLCHAPGRAKEVHLRISSPPFTHTCHFGTDIGDEENLIANRLTLREIEAQTGADTLGYISLEGLRQACRGSRLPLCDGCFTGRYATRWRGRAKTYLNDSLCTDSSSFQNHLYFALYFPSHSLNVQVVRKNLAKPLDTRRKKAYPK